MWTQVVLVPLFLRAYKDNFVGLTPYFNNFYILPPICISFVLISCLQSFFGGRFFIPKRCIPGYFNYFVKVSTVPKEDH
jgi:hypothetical protein